MNGDYDSVALHFPFHNNNNVNNDDNGNSNNANAENSPFMNYRLKQYVFLSVYDQSLSHTTCYRKNTVNKQKSKNNCMARTHPCPVHVILKALFDVFMM